MDWWDRAPCRCFLECTEGENNTWQGDGTQLGGRALEWASPRGRLSRGLHLLVSAETSPTWSKPGEASAHGWSLRLGSHVEEDSQGEPGGWVTPGSICRLQNSQGRWALLPWSHPREQHPQGDSRPTPWNMVIKRSGKMLSECAWMVQLWIARRGVSSWTSVFPAGDPRECRGNFLGRHLSQVSHLPANLASLLCPRCLVAFVYTGLYHSRGTLMCDLEPSWPSSEDGRGVPLSMTLPLSRWEADKWGHPASGQWSGISPWQWALQTRQRLNSQNPSPPLFHALEAQCSIWGLMYACNCGFPGGATGKELAWQCRRHEMWVWPLGQEDPLEEEMATHSSILAWEVPWTEEPGGLQSLGVAKSQTRFSD